MKLPRNSCMIQMDLTLENFFEAENVKGKEL